jgi:hypothetical protein
MPVEAQTFMGVKRLIKVKQLFQKRFTSALSVATACVILFFIPMPQGGGRGGAFDDLIELTAVQPDPATLWAVINLDTLTLSNPELVHTCGTQ